MAQFGQGQPINKRGRPKKGESLTDVLRHTLDRMGPDGTRNSVAIAERLIRLAIAGNVAAISLIFDRVEGKPVQPVDITLRQVAEKIAQAEGLDADELIRVAEEIVADAK